MTNNRIKICPFLFLWRHRDKRRKGIGDIRKGINMLEEHLGKISYLFTTLWIIRGESPLEVLYTQPHRCQWVLYLMGDLLGHILPHLLPLYFC